MPTQSRRMPFAVTSTTASIATSELWASIEDRETLDVVLRKSLGSQCDS